MLIIDRQLNQLTKDIYALPNLEDLLDYILFHYWQEVGISPDKDFGK